MSNYPELADVFVNKSGSDAISSSDPNNAFDGIEATQGLIGALGKPQSWSTTLLTVMRRYKRGMRIEVDNGTLYARAGEAVLENTNGSKLVFRKNSADVTISAGNIDVGTLVATFYYIYATGGTAATTCPIVFSTDALAPANIGTAPYRPLGWFYNAAVGALTCTYCGDIIDGSGGVNFNQYTSIASVVGTYHLTASAFATIPNFEIPFISNGRPVKFQGMLCGTVVDQANNQFRMIFAVDGTNIADSETIANFYTIGMAEQALNFYIYKPTAGAHIAQLKACGDTVDVCITHKRLTVEEC